MSIYDKLGSTYDSLRSDVGIKDIRHQVNVFQREINVLDLGCGTGNPIARAVSPIVKRYFGIDNSQPMLDAYLKNVPDADCLLLNMSDINQMPEGWDLVFSWGAICHLPFELQRKTMSVVADLLSPGGRFVFTGGKEAGKCTGSVGEYTVHQYSLGATVYTEFLAMHGLDLVHAGFSEGGNYLYVFTKKT